MKYLFFVQGEGRGHLTQALALKEKLEKRGQEIVAIITGEDSKHKLPAFFKEQISCPLFTIDSPNFIIDKQEKGIKVFASTLLTIWRLPRYVSAVKKIKKIVADLNPDTLVNFYEPLAGTYYRLYKNKRPMFCIAHHYFIRHQVFKFPKINKLELWSFQFYNWLTAPSQAGKIALSFTAEADEPQKKLFICPPLIRSAVKQQPATASNFILVYLLNAGYSREIINWGQTHHDVNVEAFWNRPDKEEETYYGQNLVFHRLSGPKFINCLANCHTYVATAGFDSIAEAAYLQKKILMIPTKNHFEQRCNAADAERAQVSASAKHFDLSLITDNKIKAHPPEALDRFKEWVDNYDDKIVNLLEKQ
jgi:uncharacterized protein (TIGR00661 family)